MVETQKLRFEVVLEYPEDIHGEDAEELALETLSRAGCVSIKPLR
jgi:hypothetical protein